MPTPLLRMKDHHRQQEPQPQRHQMSLTIILSKAIAHRKWLLHPKNKGDSAMNSAKTKRSKKRSRNNTVKFHRGAHKHSNHTQTAMTVATVAERSVLCPANLTPTGREIPLTATRAAVSVAIMKMKLKDNNNSDSNSNSRNTTEILMEGATATLMLNQPQEAPSGAPSTIIARSSVARICSMI